MRITAAQAGRLLESDHLTAEINAALRPDGPYPNPHVETAAWAASIIRALPHKFAAPLRKRYVTLFKREGQYAANVMLRTTVREALDRVKLGHAQDDDAIRAEAKRRAADCAKLSRWSSMESFARWHRVTPPMPGKSGVTLEGACLRLRDEMWWRRQLRKRDGRAVETLGRDLNLINRRAQCYASDEAVERRRQQKARNRALMKSIRAESDLGDTTTLEALHDKSVSNPAVKRGELMTRARGFEEYAKEQGYVAEFFTVSCPSKYHRAYSESGLENPRWSGASPRDAQSYLCRGWSRVRAAAARDGITPYGFRVCEPHHDGCPHWHLLLFVPEGQGDALYEIIRAEALREDGDELGAEQHRVKRETIDPTKGSAVGYIAKYIAKNIDGFKLEDDLYGNSGEDAAGRIDAWAATWGIRQFQQIGGPPVGLWRELRRADAQAGNATLERARTAAGAGRWCDFIKAVGNARKCAVSLITQAAETANRYGEVAARVVVGVTDSIYAAYTRLRSWTFSFSRAASAPWTCVNNCTGHRDLMALEAGP